METGDKVQVTTQHHGRAARPRVMSYTGTVVRTYGIETPYAGTVERVVVALDPSGVVVRTFYGYEVAAVR